MLQSFGRTDKTDYFNVLVMKVDDVVQFLQAITEQIEDMDIQDDVFSRIMPANITYNFQTATEFETQLKQAVEPWLQQLADGSFHARMHRRGFKGRLSSVNFSVPDTRSPSSAVRPSIVRRPSLIQRSISRRDP